MNNFLTPLNSTKVLNNPLTRNWEPVWPIKFGHSISVTQFSSLIIHHLSLITHHSNFHIRLPSLSNFYRSIFFILFMDPTTVTVLDHFCFFTHVPFSSPSIFLFFSFPLPLQPCLSPKAETQTQKNVSTSLASSVPSSPVNIQNIQTNLHTNKQNNNNNNKEHFKVELWVTKAQDTIIKINHLV